MYNVIRFDELDSTNKYALREMAVLSHQDIILADTQSAGRGRLGRQWVSPPTDNLYFSIIIKNFLNLEQNVFLSAVFALAVLTVLNEKYQLKTRLKWPNDVMIGHQKLCGILAESNSQGLAIGVGLNVNMPKEQLAKIDCPAISMAVAARKNFEREAVFNDIITEIFAFLKTIEERGLEQVVLLWQEALQIIDKKIEAETPQGNFSGVVKAINPDGSLLVDTELGQKKILTGDVKYVA